MGLQGYSRILVPLRKDGQEEPRLLKLKEARVFKEAAEKQEGDDRATLCPKNLLRLFLWGNPKQPVKLQQPRYYDFWMLQ